MLSPVISIEGVSKTFPGVRALNDVKFELLPGEVHALMGENGAGKSTLMKILAGVYTKDSGTILYNGEPVAFASPREAQAAGVGIIHQELQLMNHLTVAQNIFIGREPRRAFGLLLDEDKLNRQAKALLDHMQLALDPRANVGSLTVAKQQMVEIAKNLSYNTRVLIMDEPTAALNAAEIDELFKIIRELKGRRRRDHLYFPQGRRTEADLRPRHRAARRRIRRHGSDRDDQHRHDHFDDGRANARRRDARQDAGPA